MIPSISMLSGLGNSMGATGLPLDQVRSRHLPLSVDATAQPDYICGVRGYLTLMDLMPLLPYPATD